VKLPPIGRPKSSKNTTVKNLTLRAKTSIGHEFAVNQQLMGKKNAGRIHLRG
jgi:hypothetical protein